MANCDGTTWFSNVDGERDGTLDLDNLEHRKQGGGRDRFRMFCGGGLIIIAKANHVYGGRLIEDGFYEGYKLSRGRGKKKPLDEPTDGTWTAQQGPGEEGDDKKKPHKKSAGKAAKPGTKKAAKSSKKK